MESSLVRRVRQSPRLRQPAIAAYRAADRMMPAPPGPRVVANSMPKSGTHLLTSLLDQLEGMRFSGRLVMFTERNRDDFDAGQLEQKFAEVDKRVRKLRPSHYLGSHMVWHEQVEQAITGNGARVITILRDPRAVVVSGMHYLRDAEWMPNRDLYRQVMPDDAAVLRALIRGTGDVDDAIRVPEIGQHYDGYARWLDAEGGLTVRFEDLVGARGGGSEDGQVEQVARILDYLGYGTEFGTPGESVEALARRMFSENAVTFRSGRVDSWRDELPADLADEVGERCATAMARLGYT